MSAAPRLASALGEVYRGLRIRHPSASGTPSPRAILELSKLYRDTVRRPTTGGASQTRGLVLNRRNTIFPQPYATLGFPHDL